MEKCKICKDPLEIRNVNGVDKHYCDWCNKYFDIPNTGRKITIGKMLDLHEYEDYGYDDYYYRHGTIDDLGDFGHWD